MFYIKVFFKSLIQSSWKGVLFLTLTFLFIFSAFNVDILKKYLAKVNSPHINVLIFDKEKAQVFVKKIKHISSVKRIEKIPEKRVSKSLREIKKGFSGELPEALFQDQLHAYKIFLKKNMTLKTVDLIHEYLYTLLGRDEVVVSNIMNWVPKSSQKKEKFELKKNYHYVIVVAFSILWLLSFLLVKDTIHRTSYLINEFQRRRFGAVLSYLSGILSLTTMVGILSISFFKFNIFSLFYVMAFFLLASIWLTVQYKWNY